MRFLFNTVANYKYRKIQNLSYLKEITVSGYLK